VVWGLEIDRYLLIPADFLGVAEQRQEISTIVFLGFEIIA
jgi:hypothetical protein